MKEAPPKGSPKWVMTFADMSTLLLTFFVLMLSFASIDVAAEIQKRFQQLEYLYDMGEIDLKMSGCMNGCAHHSIGHIGILGVDKKGVEWYQFTLGGFSETEAKLGQRLGRAIAKADVADTVEKIAQVYIEQRQANERFVDTFYRIGIEPFKGRVYETN